MERQFLEYPSFLIIIELQIIVKFISHCYKKKHVSCDNLLINLKRMPILKCRTTEIEILGHRHTNTRLQNENTKQTTTTTRSHTCSTIPRQ